MQGEAAKGFPEAALKLLASALLVLYLLAAWGSGLDRLSIVSPSLERLVPGPLRAQADRSAAAIALARGDSQSALHYATEAVLHDPIDPLSDSLLGSARQYRGDTAGAEAAFRVAATRGWRDRLTQLYWYGAAIETGDAERAALRADALLRSDPYFAASGTILEPLEASPAGRVALARRLAENPGWAIPYLSVPATADARQVQLKSGIALLAAQQHGALDCATPRPLVEVLLARGMRRDAEQLWRAACGGKSLAGVPQGGLYDGAFDRLGAGASESSPFDWRKHADGDVAIDRVATGGRGFALTLRNSASVSRLALSQAVALAPGQYRVRAKATRDGKAAEGSIAISLDCGAQPRRPADVTGDVATTGQSLAIGDCDSQVLGVWLRPGGGDLTFDDVTIEKVR